MTYDIELHNIKKYNNKDEWTDKDICLLKNAELELSLEYITDIENNHPALMKYIINLVNFLEDHNKDKRYAFNQYNRIITNDCINPCILLNGTRYQSHVIYTNSSVKFFRYTLYKQMKGIENNPYLDNKERKTLLAPYKYRECKKCTVTNPFSKSEAYIKKLYKDKKYSHWLSAADYDSEIKIKENQLEDRMKDTALAAISYVGVNGYKNDSGDTNKGLFQSSFVIKDDAMNIIKGIFLDFDFKEDKYMIPDMILKLERLFLSLSSRRNIFKPVILRSANGIHLYFYTNFAKPWKESQEYMQDLYKFLVMNLYKLILYYIPELEPMADYSVKNIGRITTTPYQFKYDCKGEVPRLVFLVPSFEYIEEYEKLGATMQEINGYYDIEVLVKKFRARVKAIEKVEKVDKTQKFVEYESIVKSINCKEEDKTLKIKNGKAAIKNMIESGEFDHNNEIIRKIKSLLEKGTLKRLYSNDNKDVISITDFMQNHLNQYTIDLFNISKNTLHKIFVLYSQGKKAGRCIRDGLRDDQHPSLMVYVNNSISNKYSYEGIIQCFDYKYCGEGVKRTPLKADIVIQGYFNVGFLTSIILLAASNGKRIDLPVAVCEKIKNMESLSDIQNLSFSDKEQEQLEVETKKKFAEYLEKNMPNINKMHNVIDSIDINQLHPFIQPEWPNMRKIAHYILDDAVEFFKNNTVLKNGHQVYKSVKFKTLFFNVVGQALVQRLNMELTGHARRGKSEYYIARVLDYFFNCGLFLRQDPSLHGISADTLYHCNKIFVSMEFNYNPEVFIRNINEKCEKIKDLYKKAYDEGRMKRLFTKNINVIPVHMKNSHLANDIVEIISDMSDEVLQITNQTIEAIKVKNTCHEIANDIFNRREDWNTYAKMVNINFDAISYNILGHVPSRQSDYKLLMAKIRDKRCNLMNFKKADYSLAG